MQRAPLVLPAATFVLAILAEAHGGFVAFALACAGAAGFAPAVTVAGLAGLAVGRLHGHPASIERERRSARYAVTVTGDVRADEGAVMYAVDVPGIGTLRANGRALVRAGERLVLVGRIEPLDEPRNPGEPSARELGIDEGIVGELRVERIVARAPPDWHDLRIWPALARERASRIVRAALPEPGATVLAGALWGERGTLPRALRDDFQATGTVHVLVTAGLHLGVIAALIALGFALLGMPRIAASLATIPLVCGYAWFSGWHLPSQRAAAMIAVGLIARAAGARTFSLNTLAVAAIVVSAAWPVSVASLSFALSFSCVTAIALFASPIDAWLHARRIPPLVAEALALTASTQIGVWPLTAFAFFTLAPYAVLANAIVVPLVGVAMTLGLATLVAHPLAGLATIVVRLETWLLAILVLTTHTIAMLPGARVTIPPPPVWSIVAYDAAVLVAAALARHRARTAGAIVGAASLGVLAVALWWHPRGFAITVLDVGQGDGIVVRTPHGRTILIDTGGRLERGATIDGESPAERSADRIVVPYLARAGIRRVDAMILTHPHGDHVGGAATIVRTLPVGWIADSGQTYGGRAYADALAQARQRRVAIIVPSCHQTWSDDGVTLTFLTPCGPPFVDGDNDVNENSLVVLLAYRGFRALFMGDAGFQSEARLLAQGVDLHATLLKVGHHGSAYSSSPAFIRAVAPRIALVSVGRHNLFGHPAPVTLATLATSGASVWRTDRCGAVTVTLDSHDEPHVKSMIACR